MTSLLFNSNSQWFETPENIELGIQISDGDLFSVRCKCFSWSVKDIHQEWGVDDFPEQPALRIANFIMQPASIGNLDFEYAQSQTGYWVLLHPLNSQNFPVPVLCDATSKQFFGVATDKDSARRVAEAEEKSAWITVVVRINLDEYSNEIWAELSVNRQNSDNWACAEVRFEKP